MEAATVQRRILLVEDDHDLRLALSDALEERGHTVVAVNDGRVALRQMRMAQPDVVVLDLMMPGMDGWQFRVEQKRDPGFADTPVIAISASPSPTAAAIDAALYLQKPLDAEKLLEGIEDVLRARDRRLAPARAVQTERMAALGSLAAGLAHEINNPLTYVLLNLTHAVRFLPGLAVDGNRKRVQEIEAVLKGALEGAERIRAITMSIRTFSRVGEPRMIRLDVGRVLDAALELVMHEVRQRARLTKDYRDTPSVLADEGRLGQVFLNLISNAVQAIDEGHIGANEIRVSTGTDGGGRAVVTVEDTGRGIEEHLLERIFEPFFSTKQAGQGTGLGLSISRDIVGSLGGEIAVSSRPGRGTTFRVTLPPAPPEISEPASRPELRDPPPHSLPRRRLLVIDDESAVCAGIRQALGDANEVVVSSGGRHALELLRTGTEFDLILCDVQMPGFTGREFHDELRTLRPALADRVVFMTAGAFTPRGREVFGTEARLVLEKPLDLDRLRALLAET